MNSLEIIKQELINQKNILEQRGIVVNTINLNPSPSEITQSLEDISDFLLATAKEEDVRAGKTFYAQNNQLKTGTYDLSVVDTLNNKIIQLLSCTEDTEIILPDTLTEVRPYAFFSNYTTGKFYKHDMVIPDSVKRVNNYGFYYSNLTGKLEIPKDCLVGSNSFSYSNISELIMGGGFIPSSSYSFTNCKLLKKVTITGQIDSFPVYIFQNSTALEELILNKEFKSLATSYIANIKTLKYVQFTGNNPPTMPSEFFKNNQTASIIVPYDRYSIYFNATNYQQYAQPMYGWGYFEQLDVLPTSIEGYNITWYNSFDDAVALTNPINVCANSGTLYAVMTEIETTE